MITADCVIIDNNKVSSNESGLTGEPKDLRKSRTGDCFLLSSCLVTEGEGCRAMVIGVGKKSIARKYMLDPPSWPRRARSGGTAKVM